MPTAARERVHVPGCPLLITAEPVRDGHLSQRAVVTSRSRPFQRVVELHALRTSFCRGRQYFSPPRYFDDRGRPVRVRSRTRRKRLQTRTAPRRRRSILNTDCDWLYVLHRRSQRQCKSCRRDNQKHARNVRELVRRSGIPRRVSAPSVSCLYSPTMSPPVPRKTFGSNRKVDVVRCKDPSRSSTRRLADKFGIGNTRAAVVTRNTEDRIPPVPRGTGQAS
ncbi:Hypothetical protein CINCED_3A001111 [Cinara cedri]|uniref:Uncharacterized protein n=1 Tax=Cinara cedri TaxID=506608 RepID=A0A5E4NC96_9HEMI|nr:Hypothetical protein CINCED_3A001111 [Cinara cedri]